MRTSNSKVGCSRQQFSMEIQNLSKRSHTLPSRKVCVHFSVLLIVIYYEDKCHYMYISCSDLRSTWKSSILDDFCNKKIEDFSNHCNFATIGSILEILDVLNSPYRVLSKFGTLCDNARLFCDNFRRCGDNNRRSWSRDPL